MHGERTGIVLATNMIFVMRPADLDNLDDFAARAAEILNLTEFHERESSFYTEERYFKGTRGASSMRIYYIDALGIDGFHFAVAIKSPEETAAHEIASSLASAGYQCLIPSDTWNDEDWNGMGVKYGN